MLAHFSLGHLTILHLAVAASTFLLGYLLGRSEWWAGVLSRLGTSPAEPLEGSETRNR